jgi:hypothetical protein
MSFVPARLQFVPCFRKVRPIFPQTAFFDPTFESLIVADEASLNAKREERLEWHSSAAKVNRVFN